MIKINGIIVDSAVSFTQTANINERWRKKTLDNLTHREVSSVKEEVACVFAPRTETAGDILWEQLCLPNETTTIEYPNSSDTTAIKTMLITKVTRKLIKKINGINVFGEISATFTEQ